MLLFGLVSCGSDKPAIGIINTSNSPYSSGQEFTEPIYYNGKTYTVRFQLDKGLDQYSVNVGLKGTVIDSTPADQAVVSEVGRNAINHFSCGNGQKAQVVPGTLNHAGATWNMKVRCI